MVAFLIALHIFVCIALIFIVLLQPGNKQGMGAAMGGGGAQTVFGGRGANTFLSKMTVGLAAVFMLNSVVLVYVSSDTGSVTDQIVGDSSAGDTDVKAETPPAAEEPSTQAEQPEVPAAGDIAAGAGDTAAEGEAAPTSAKAETAKKDDGAQAADQAEKDTAAPKTDEAATP